MSNIEINKKVTNLVNGLRTQYQRKINNTYIWFSISHDAIDAARKNDDFLNQKRIFVPSLGVNGKKHKAIARSKEKLINVLDEAYDRDLSHMLFTYIVAQMESFFYDLLQGILLIDNRRIKIKTNKIKFIESMDVNYILDNNDYQTVIKKVIESNLISVFYASPDKQIEYIQKVFSIEFDEKLTQYFEKWKEFKAARDIIMHNDGIINETYLKKSGTLSRGVIGDDLKINNDDIENLVIYSKSIVGKLCSLIKKESK